MLVETLGSDPDILFWLNISFQRRIYKSALLSKLVLFNLKTKPSKFRYLLLNFGIAEG